MNNETYNTTLWLLKYRLQSIKGTLKADQIEEFVSSFKKSCEEADWAPVKAMGVIDLKPLSEKNWESIKYDLESSFIVRIEKGILVQSKDAKTRDLTWWTGKKKLESDNYYYDNYKEYMKSSLPKKVLDVNDDDTDVVMNNLSDPSGKNFAIKGMVVGHVQSGKTSNYAGLITKAADAGYRFIVVIAGGQNNLRNQTQKRIQDSFIGIKNVGVGTLPNFKNSRMPDCLTSETSDFKKEIAISRKTTNFENMQLPILVVIKKNTSTLTQLLEWLNDSYPNQIDKPMLVIDDESDYASINTKGENNPTVINSKIRMLLRKFTKSAYVAYTATPFANIFIDHQAKNEELGEDLFPSDFIYALSPPDNYFGAQIIFEVDEDSENLESKYVTHIPDNEVVMDLEYDKKVENSYEEAITAETRFLIRHKNDYVIDKLPPSLLEAVRVFLLNIGIRNLRDQIKHNSMLIHISRFTNMHMTVRTLVKDYFEVIKKDIKAFANVPIKYHQNKTILLMQDTYEKVHSDVDFDFQEILISVLKVIDSIQVIDIHQKRKIPLEYRDDVQTNAIVIGGLSLSRGFTLEGLSISYFLRTTVYYDTLMQMGRWFGYRIGYQDICRIYMTESMHRNFAHINQATVDLMKKLIIMEKENRTPEEFGLAVQTHPDSILQITARNKSRFTEDMLLQMDLKGQIKETRYISNNKKDIASNEAVTKQFIELLYYNHLFKRKSKTLVWENIENQLVENYVNSYKFYSKDLLGLRTRLPIAFIKEVLKEYKGKWDIVIHNGEKDEIYLNDGTSLGLKRQKRTVDDADGHFKIKKSQLARGSAESIMFDEQTKLSGLDMRMSLKNPILFIHILALETAKSENNSVNAIGLSFSFNNHSDFGNSFVNVKVNSVYIKEIEEVIKYAETDEEYEEVFEDE